MKYIGSNLSRINGPRSSRSIFELNLIFKKTFIEERTILATCIELTHHQNPEHLDISLKTAKYNNGQTCKFTIFIKYVKGKKHKVHLTF